MLEGGYSIEGALPYVNVGIILAMAGIDFSRVTEPDYDRDRIRQRDEVTRTVEEVSRLVLANWQQREEIREQHQGKADIVEHTRSIFYDTDGIRETQTEVNRICRILAVHIPRKACSSCSQLGYDWFEAADTNAFPLVFLQDRPRDQFNQKKRSA